MELIILVWYVLVATDSAFWVSVVAALRFGGTLVAPLSGVLADRLPRRLLLIGLRAGFATLAALVAVADLAGALSLWMVFAVAFLSGLARPTEMVLRQSLIADTVPAPLLTNAMGLGRTTMESARIAGALTGAGLLASLGLGLAYVGVTAVYLVAIAFTLRIRAPGRAVPREPASPRADLVAGIRYLRGAPPLMVMMGLAFMVNLSAFPVTQGFLPVMARDVFGFDANGLARMVAAVGAGALVGSVLIAALARSHRPERMMLAGLVVWHGLLVGLGFVASAGVLYAVLVLVGLLSVSAMIPMSVSLMVHTEPDFRGRVMGVRMLAVYGLPVGLLLGGALMELAGPSVTLAVHGTVGLIPALAATWCWRAWVR